MQKVLYILRGKGESVTFSTQLKTVINLHWVLITTEKVGGLNTTLRVLHLPAKNTIGIG